MSSLQDLLAQRAEIEKKIADVQREERATAINKVRAMMAEFGLTAADIAGKAAKFAILHHLEYIFANPFVNVSAMDVTNEVIEELRLSKK